MFKSKKLSCKNCDKKQQKFCRPKNVAKGSSVCVAVKAHDFRYAHALALDRLPVKARGEGKVGLMERMRQAYS